MSNIRYFVEKVDKVNYCGGDFLQLTVTQFKPPFQTKPTTGERHDYKTCENCLSSLVQLKISLQHKYEKFPHCCKFHSNLVSKDFFHKIDFKDVHIHTAEKIIFTYQHIINTIDTDNWKEEINNYIEYTVESFGKMPRNCGSPLFINTYIEEVKYRVDYSKKIKDKQKKIIYNIIDNQFKSEIVESDLKILLETYEKWLNIFPFRLHKFENIKQKFIKDIPIIVSNEFYNSYLKMYKRKLRTQTDLIEFLVNGTNKLLKELTVSQSLDNKKRQLSIISAKHNIEQQKLLDKFSKKEKKYLKTIRKWLSNEEEYINNIKPLMLDLQKGSIETEENKTIDNEKNPMTEKKDIDLDEIIMTIESNDLVKTFDILDSLLLDPTKKNTCSKFKKEYIHGNIQSDFVQRLMLFVKECYKN